MLSTELLTDALERIREEVHATTSGLSERELTARIAPGANSIAWLVWHLTRVQDDHVAELAGSEQVWTHQGWWGKFGLPFPETATGYGHTSADVGAVIVTDPQLLTGYHDAVHRATVDYVAGLGEADFERVVDERWDPPVTLAVRLISVISDDLQHVGQAAFIRGILHDG